MPPPGFDRSTILHLASLAALSLTEEELEALGKDLIAIVDYIKELQAVDTSGAAATTRLVEERDRMRLRADVVTPGLSHEDALRAAPHTADGGFAVPAFVEPSARHAPESVE